MKGFKARVDVDCVCPKCSKTFMEHKWYIPTFVKCKYCKCVFNTLGEIQNKKPSTGGE